MDFRVLILIISLSTSSAFAADKKESNGKAGNIYTNFSYTFINAPLPGSYGINFDYAISDKWLLGFDYTKASYGINLLSLNIGEITQKNYTFQAKRFTSDSLYLLMGLGYRELETKFTANLFDFATSSYSETYSNLETKYIRLGFGSQWKFKKRYTFIVDWVNIDIPFSGSVKQSAARYASSSENQSDIEDAEGILKYLPGGSTLKLNAGFIF